MSSEIFPFAAHEEYGYSLEYADKELKAAGDTAKRLGVRLTTHPGQVSAPSEVKILLFSLFTTLLFSIHSSAGES